MTKLTLIPGSFTPPHRGHWDMISYYASRSDYVIVIIASPNKALRAFRINDYIMRPAVSKSILDAFIAYSGLTNVKTYISEDPSPVKETLKIINTLKDCEITIGVSSKSSDATKYDWIRDYIQPGRNITFHHPSETAFTPIEEISASDIRTGRIAYKDALPAFLDIADIFSRARGK